MALDTHVRAALPSGVVWTINRHVHTNVSNNNNNKNNEHFFLYLFVSLSLLFIKMVPCCASGACSYPAHCMGCEGCPERMAHTAPQQQKCRCCTA